MKKPGGPTISTDYSSGSQPNCYIAKKGCHELKKDGETQEYRKNGTLQEWVVLKFFLSKILPTLF